MQSRCSSQRAGRTEPNELGHLYTKVGGPVDASACELREEQIHAMIRGRARCKLAGDYRGADELFARLMRSGVVVDDKAKQWRVDRRLTEFGHDFTQIGEPVPSTCSLTDDKIHEMISERMKCKMARDYGKADEIIDRLNRSGVEVYDKQKEWRFVGVRSGDGERRTGRRRPDERDRAYIRVGDPFDSSIGLLSEGDINDMIRERTRCKLARDYRKADLILTHLRRAGVEVDDELMQWRVDENTVQFGHSYRRVGEVDPSACMLKEEEIHRLIRGRVRCQLAGSFDKADTIRRFLRNAGVLLNDKQRLWRADDGGDTSSNDSQRQLNEHGHFYEQIGGEIDPTFCTIDEESIHNLIRERIQCKLAGDRKKAMTISKYLRNVGVVLHDKLRQWRADGLNNFDGQQHELNEHGHVYTRVGEQGVLSELDEAKVHHLLLERMKSRDTLDFDRADKIREELKRHGVTVNDERREWTATETGSAGDGPDLRNFRAFDDVVGAASDNLDVMSPKDAAAFWTLASRHLAENVIGRDDQMKTEVVDQLEKILVHTLDNVGKLDGRHLAQTTLALAKIVKMVDKQGSRPHVRCLRDLFIGTNSERKGFIFEELASASRHILSEFEPRHLSNIIYAFGLANHICEFEDGTTIFDVLASQAIAKMSDFSAWDIANVVFAYATANVSHPSLFEGVADHVASLDDLKAFNGQDCANIVWAYATANERHSKLFDKVAEHIVALEHLGSFNPQNVSNILWSYATAKESNPKLFNKVADHIIEMNGMGSFKPQALSNIVWAYATADESHPKLFDKVADNIIAIDDLDSFNPQALANTVWAYATARESNPKLFQKVADAAINRTKDFNPQGTANLLYAYAASGQIDEHFFASWESTAAAHVGKYDSQGLSNIAWSYAVANATAPSLFNDDFINTCLEKESDFKVEALLQLHQWQLWQEELKSEVMLPPFLRERCREAFISGDPNSSALQSDVVSVMTSIGLHSEEEVLMDSGYRLDAVVDANGSKVGIEVDGPAHFVDRKPNGRTLLKRRQVSQLDGCRVVSVPHWEWEQLTDSGKKQHYLRALLDVN